MARPSNFLWEGNVLIQSGSNKEEVVLLPAAQLISRTDQKNPLRRESKKNHKNPPDNTVFNVPTGYRDVIDKLYKGTIKQASSSSLFIKKLHKLEL